MVIQLQPIKNYIKHSHRQTLSGIFATFSLCLFTLLMVFPIVGVEQKTEAATGTASTTSLTLTTTGGASLDLAVDSNNGTFATTDPASSNYSSTSTQAEFTVTTTNYTGYTLSISNSDSDTNLTASDTTSGSSTIASIGSATGSSAVPSTGISATTFNTTAYNGMWGYKPSMLNSSSNSNYLPSPTTTATTLNITNCANGKSNGSNTCPDAVDTYTIDLAARLEYTQSSGNYTHTFILATVGNPITYTINYADNTGDSTVSGIPTTPTSGSTSDTSIVLKASDTASDPVPTRTGYTFKGWCLGTVASSGTTCNGTTTPTYTGGGSFGIDQTTTNSTTLYAMWEIKSFTQTTRVRYEDANGNWSSYTTVDTSTVNYNSSYSWSTSSLSGFDTSTYQSASVSSYTVTEAKTNDVSIYRNTHTLTVSAGSNTSSASGSGTYRVGQTVPVSVSKYSSTTCTTYNTPTWSKSSGATGTFSSTSGSSVNYTIGTTNDTVTATSSSSSNSLAITLYAYSGASGIYLDGTYYSSGSTAYKTCGSYSISGSYSSGYTFDYWSYSGNSVNSTSSSSTTYTVSGTGTLYLYGKSTTTYMQDFTASMCSSQASSASKTVTDSRDGKTYTVRYINGACWMTSNLRYLGDTGSTSTSMIVKSATTNYNSNTTLTLKDLTNGSGSSSDCYGSWNDSSDTYTGKGWTNLCVHEGTDNNGNPTVWYNYSAATVGTIATKGANSTAATYDVCPKNWRLPTSSEQSGITSYTIAFSPVYGGNYDNGSLNYATTRGHWWSATASNARGRYRLYYNSGSLSTSGDYRYRGFYVRCIRSA